MYVRPVVDMMRKWPRFEGHIVVYIKSTTGPPPVKKVNYHYRNECKIAASAYTANKMIGKSQSIVQLTILEQILDLKGTFEGSSLSFLFMDSKSIPFKGGDQKQLCAEKGMSARPLFCVMLGFYYSDP